MTHTQTLPRSREIKQACQSIRAHWTRGERRERRQLAAARQRQLRQLLAAASTSM